MIVLEMSKNIIEKNTSDKYLKKNKKKFYKVLVIKEKVVSLHSEKS